ncbi:hypothetical protein ACQJBY_036407 [Aegilops geniculata]
MSPPLFSPLASAASSPLSCRRPPPTSYLLLPPLSPVPAATQTLAPISLAPRSNRIHSHPLLLTAAAPFLPSAPSSFPDPHHGADLQAKGDEVWQTRTTRERKKEDKKEAGGEAQRLAPLRLKPRHHRHQIHLATSLPPMSDCCVVASGPCRRHRHRRSRRHWMAPSVPPAPDRKLRERRERRRGSGEGRARERRRARG